MKTVINLWPGFILPSTSDLKNVLNSSSLLSQLKKMSMSES